jgi:fibronectin type 3 domain-containing protein
MYRIAATLVFVLTLCAIPACVQTSVRLSWVASSDAAGNPSLTYNVYRASSCPGQFIKLNTSAIAVTTYVDPGVAVGAAYCYQVTAFLNGVESTASNQATTAVPPPTNRQATCGHRGALLEWIRCVTARPKRASQGAPTP